MNLKIHICADTPTFCRYALCGQAYPFIAFNDKHPTCKRCVKIKAEKEKRKGQS